MPDTCIFPPPPQALDYLEPAVPEEPSGRLRYPSTADSYCSSELEAERRSKEDVDVLIRMAFVEFLFSPEILGQVERHLCVFRLFPRPVVALRGKAFMAGYQKASPTTSPAFITSLIKSQVHWTHITAAWGMNDMNMYMYIHSCIILYMLHIIICVHVHYVTSLLMDKQCVTL